MKLSRLLAALAIMAPLAAPADELLIHGGTIYTGTGNTVEAVYVRNQLIAFAGPLAEAQELILGEELEEIHLPPEAGLYPGFTDAHAHLAGIGFRELILNLEDTTSIADLVSRVRGTATMCNQGELIIGRGWIETDWPEQRFPTRQDLDEATTSHPVLLTRADGHALVANSYALREAGISASTIDPDGGEILRDEQGEPTGFLVDRAMDLVVPLLPADDAERTKQALRIGADKMAEYGWTGIHNMSVPFVQIGMMAQLAETGDLPLRVYNAVDASDAGRLFSDGAIRLGNGLVTARAIKLYIDGALGSRGAALLEPYDDAPSSSGLLIVEQREVMPLMEQALRKGIQVAMHAIGDRGNRLALDWYADAFASVSAADRAVGEPRWRIEHAQHIAGEDIPRFAAMGVIPSMQPSHAIGDLHFADERLGIERLDDAYPWQALLDAGSIIPGGSDAPVERGDPLIEFYAAVSRKDLAGFQGAGWHPEQAVDRTAALKMFTIWPAYAAFAEAELGTIEVGKRADLSAFSADIMTIPVDQIPRQRALLTVVNGAVAYREE